MAALVVIDKQQCCPASLAHERLLSLQEWLQDDWAAVFSKPDDFAPPPGTPAGFVTCIAESVRTAGIKPIAFGRSLEPLPASWLDHAVNDDAVVLLDCEHRKVVDLTEYTLAAKLTTLGPAFVAIIDTRGRVRMTLKYRSGDRSRTLLDVVEIVAALKNQTDIATPPSSVEVA